MIHRRKIYHSPNHNSHSIHIQNIRNNNFFIQGKKSKMSKNPQWAGIHNLDSLDQMQTVEVDPESRERRHKGKK